MSKVENKTSLLSNQYAQLRKQISQQRAFSPFVSNPAYIKPEMSQGYLLEKRGLVPSIVIGAKDTANDAVELTRALSTGKSCDNSLGRMNDLGLKLGGLGIAAYLASKRGTKTKGLMEFLGFGTFFASMALWPRVMIADPLEKRFGFDIRQKYIDSQGRKKLFFQDNQYQPWDLWSNEKLDEIGDKMGVDKNIPERRELIKQKMRAVALQGNTLWMLTAGFSPVFTSLICNLAERGVTCATINSQYAHAANTAKDFDGAVKKLADSELFDAKARKDFSKLMKDYSGKQPDEYFFKEAARLLDPIRLVQDSKDVDAANIVDGMTSGRLKIAQNLKDIHKTMCPDDTKIMQYDVLKDKIKGIVVTDGVTGRTTSVKDKILPALEDLFTITDSTKTKEVQVEAVMSKVDELITDKKLAALIKTKINKALEDVDVRRKSPQEFYEGVRGLFEATSKELNARTKVIADTINAVAGQKYESVHTNIHLKSLKAFMEELMPTVDDLDIARKDSKASFEYLTKALGKKVENDGAYKAFIDNLAQRQAKFESEDMKGILDKATDFSKTTFEKFFNNPNTDNAAKAQGPFAFLKDMVLGNTKDGKKSSFVRVLDGFIEEKTAGIRATSHRIIMAADLERRIHTGTLQKQWAELGGDASRFDEICRIARRTVYDATMNDLANKQYLTGNGDEAVKIFKLIFLKDMDKATLAGENLTEVVVNAVNDSRRNIFGVYNSAVDLARQGHKAVDEFAANAVQKTQYAMVGKPLSELFMETASKTFNDKRWMKMFGGLAAGVAAVTLITQMFFGKVKDEELYKNAKKQEGVNNAK